jgi:hypothetical protein
MCNQKEKRRKIDKRYFEICPKSELLQLKWGKGMRESGLRISWIYHFILSRYSQKESTQKL